MRVVKGNPTTIEQDGFRFPLLVSYAYLRKATEKTQDYILNHAKADGFEVLLDCGAFSAANAGHEITLDEYMGFLHKHKDSFFAYIALDKLKDPVQTEINLKEMYAAGLDPCPVHTLGDDEKRMDELFELSDLVFLGGLRRPGRGAAPKPYVAQKMAWAKGRHAHWLGYTNIDMIKTFTPYSCDCSSWSGAQRWGQCDIYVGKGRWLPFERKGRLASLPPKVLWHIQNLGYNEQDWRTDDNWRMTNGQIFMTMDIMTDSWLRYIMDVRRSFGTRIFLACTIVSQQMEAIRKHWDRMKTEEKQRAADTR